MSKEQFLVLCFVFLELAHREAENVHCVEKLQVCVKYLQFQPLSMLTYIFQIPDMTQ